jgi:tRNA uridine 5-carboxymethylaminomethyl modification enzyme
VNTQYDVIVIGGGHAGTEAAWAASSVLRGRGRVALITMNPSKTGVMSCNPAIGGLAKGQMVREIDALGGIMGRAIDATGIMFKMLNTSRGAAVHGPRAQADKYAYAAEVQRLLATRDNIDVIAGTIDDIIVDSGRIVGVRVPAGAGVVRPDTNMVERNAAHTARALPVYAERADERDRIAASTIVRASAVVLTTGTFMRALMHTGDRKAEGGRVDEGSAVGISATLRTLGFDLGRLKTGTPPRLTRESIDWDSLKPQCGDVEPLPFSDLSPAGLADGRFPALPQIDCRITETTHSAHELIRANLHRAPMYCGDIDAECGPRYCPSIEDKVVRFADRESHHVFLEPESLHTNEVYCNGISTSLPDDVQAVLVRELPGCARAVIMKWGYAVEYDMVWPHQIDSTCMTKSVAGFFLAGQINGTSGYEEAGGQGLIAGLNAARLHLGADLIRLGREQAYIGVMLDDLVTKTPREPYRMFTSRAEHRLLLRADNTDVRLTPAGRELGLVDDVRWSVYETRSATLDLLRDAFQRTKIGGKSLADIARRPDSDVDAILPYLPDHLNRAAHGASNGNATTGAPARHLVQRIIVESKYDGYIVRQHAEIRRQRDAERKSIPVWLDYAHVTGLRAEAREVLGRFRPNTMGQAGRLAGVSPADLTLVTVALQRLRTQRSADPDIDVLNDQDDHKSADGIHAPS